jgi:hypothetical protein
MEAVEFSEGGIRPTRYDQVLPLRVADSEAVDAQRVSAVRQSYASRCQFVYRIGVKCLPRWDRDL